jgi:hypothetical protein
MTGETRQVTVRASRWKVMQWEDAAIHIKGRDVRRFMILAADWLTRRLREANYQRNVPDPIGQRLDEKHYLGKLMKAARVAVDHLPKQVDTYLRGPIYPKRDLQHAIENVRGFLNRVGDEYPSGDE